MGLLSDAVISCIFLLEEGVPYDGKTIVPTGGSMGGRQSLVLACLRPKKVTAALVWLPADADRSTIALLGLVA